MSRLRWFVLACTLLLVMSSAVAQIQSISNALFHFTQASNLQGNGSFINQPFTNANPSAVLFVNKRAYTTPNAQTAPVGVFYNTQPHPDQWQIVNLNPSVNMTSGLTFTVKVMGRGQTVFVHAVSAQNLTGFNNHMTVLDHPFLNNQPNAKPIVTQLVANGLYNTAEVGLAYSAAINRWQIVNQNSAPMPLGAQFNVYVPMDNGLNFVHTVSAQNVSADPSATVLSHPLLANDQAGLLFTYATVPAGSTFSLDAPLASDYANGAWRIRRLDGLPMPVGARFHVHINTYGDAIGDGELNNGGFEVPGVSGAASAVNWVQVRAGAGSQRLCNVYSPAPQIVAQSGECAYRLQGALGQNRYITQFNTVFMQPNQSVDIRAYVRGVNLAGASITAVYTLSNGSTVTLTIPPSALVGTFDYRLVQANAALPAGLDATQITVTVAVNNSAGTLFIDDMSALAAYEPPAPLPLPTP